MHEREVCTLIDRIVSGEPTEPEVVESVIAFLSDILPLHLADEEIDLFPLLTKRCEPEDEIGKVIAKLQYDHEHALSDSPRIVALLNGQIDEPTGFSDAARAQMSSFAAHARRHLILENAILLPIARLRLTPADLAAMKRHMIERRGADPLETDTSS
jgi:hemerythrin-like domain-containing protein